MTELQETLELLADRPFAGTAVVDSELPGARRISLNRTHYFLYCFVQNDEVSVVALWHQRRGDRPELHEER